MLYIRTLINADSTKCTDDWKGRNILNDFFTSVFKNDNRKMPTLLKETMNTSSDHIILPHLLLLEQ